MTLKKTAKIWKEPLLNNIYRYQKNGKNTQIYAITEQETNFEKLDTEKILGLTQIENREPDVHYINVLQTNPKYTMDVIGRKYKKIGTTILDNLKKIFSKGVLKTTPICDDNIINFYKENDFKFENFYLGDLIWLNKFNKQ